MNMKIKYIHLSNPEEEKVMNSVTLRNVDENFARNLFGNSAKTRTQEEYDEWLLKKLKKEKIEGKILRYEIIKEEI